MASPKRSIGIRFPKIGLGTVQFGLDYGLTKAKTQEEVNEILDICVKRGVGFIDTARDYGTSEEKIGRYLKKNSRRHFTIATKIARIPRPMDKNELRAHLEKSIDASRRILGIEKLDILQLHQDDDFLTENPYFWGLLEDLRGRGRFGLFGVSLYETGIAESILRRRHESIDVIQAPYSVFDRRFEKLFPLFRSRGIRFVCRSVFLKGLIAVPKEKVPAELASLVPHKDELEAVASKAGLTAEEAALLFVASDPFIDTVILGVDSAAELDANVMALGKTAAFRRIAGELRKIEVLDPFLLDPRQWRSL